MLLLLKSSIANFIETGGGALNLVVIECEAKGIVEVFTKEGTWKCHPPCWEVAEGASYDWEKPHQTTATRWPEHPKWRACSMTGRWATELKTQLQTSLPEEQRLSTIARHAKLKQCSRWSGQLEQQQIETLEKATGP